jgi:uncharacterized protein (TIGR03437 family)
MGFTRSLVTIWAAVALAGPALAQYGVTPLSPGVPTAFNVPATSDLQLLCCFSLAVPEDVLKIQVTARMSTGVQYAIGLKYGSLFSTTRFDNDHGGITSVETVTVTRSSSPPLRAGTYYVGVLLVFTPSGTGSLTATLSRSAPLIDVGAASLNFGNVETGLTGEKNLTIRNTGTETLTVSSILTSNPRFEVVSPPRPFTVAASAERAAVIRFQPTAAGAQSGTTTIASDDLGRPSVTVSLEGVGVEGPRVAVSATALTFTAQSGTAAVLQTFTVRNSGAGTLNFRITTTQPWITVSPASGSVTTGTATITVGVSTVGMNVGTYTGEIRVAVDRPDPPGPAVIAVRLTLAEVTSVLAASLAPGSAAAPESIVSAFGQRLATTTEVATTTPLPTSLAGTSLTVKDSTGVERLAPLYFVSPGQINYLVPAGAAMGPATVTVTVGGQTAGTGRLQIDPVAPGLFTANADGRGAPRALALRVRADGTQSAEPVFKCGTLAGSCFAAPLSLGAVTDQVILLLFGTGMRGLSGPAAASVVIGGETAEVLGVAPQGEYAGLDQVNVRLPRSLVGRGEVPLVLTVDGRAANTVTVNVGPATPVQLEAAGTARVIETTGCRVPEEVTRFLTTDDRVWMWFLVRNVRAGDVPLVEWRYPDGSVYRREVYDPAARDSASSCYWAWILIVRYPPAASPGLWTVRVLWNGLLLSSHAFVIAAPGG